MKILKLLTTMLFSALLLSGCISKNEDAIVTVNSQPITKASYDKAYKVLSKDPNFAQLPAEMRNDPDSYINLVYRDKIIKELIIKSLLDQEISKKNIVVTEEDVNDEIVNITDKIGSKDKLNELLKQNNITMEQLKNDILEELKLRRLIETLSIVKVTDKDAQKYYRENIDTFKYPDKVRASHILIKASEASIADEVRSANKKLSDEEIKTKVDEEMARKLAKIQTIQNELKLDPTKFAELAKQHSEDVANAYLGGDLGFFAFEEMVKPFSESAFKQKVNTIGEIVQTDFGYHIIMVTDRKQAGVEPYNKVKDELIMLLENQKKVEVLQELVETLKNKAEIVYVDEMYNLQTIEQKLQKVIEENPALGIQPQSAKE